MGDIYLYYGDDEAGVNEAKLKTLQSLLPPEEREYNVSEFSPPANRFTLPLQKAMPGLIAELRTRSMFKEGTRIAIVYNLDAFYQSEPSAKNKAKKSVLNAFLDFLKHQFVSLPNVLIFVCTENPDKGRWVITTSPLTSFVREAGSVKVFRSHLRQQFIDSILARNSVGTVRALRQWWARTKSPVPVFNALVYLVEVLLQAKLLSEKRRYGLADKDLKERFLKRSMTVSFFKEYPQRQNKILHASRNYTIKELTVALEELLKLNVYVYPQQSDKYVPDISALLEKFVIELTGGTL
ncbi:hypothetical protein J7M23_08580 [Candidatus Sumerlaeota bacterium]|nr:hypothetical protein [Candidatus Sumerlaeota bacterium]